MKIIRVFVIAVLLSSLACWAIALLLYGWGTTGKAYAFFDGLYVGAFVSFFVYGFARLMWKENMSDIHLISIATLASTGLYYIWHVLLMV